MKPIAEITKMLQVGVFGCVCNKLVKYRKQISIVVQKAVKKNWKANGKTNYKYSTSIIIKHKRPKYVT